MNCTQVNSCLLILKFSTLLGHIKLEVRQRELYLVNTKVVNTALFLRKDRWYGAHI